jgi:hypothetical protein
MLEMLIFRDGGSITFRSTERSNNSTRLQKGKANAAAISVYFENIGRKAIPHGGVY